MNGRYSTIKKMAIVTLAFALIIRLLNGCDNNPDSHFLVKYLNDRYDDHFAYVSPFGGTLGDTSTQILASSERYPDHNVWVCHEIVNGVETYSDNYVDIVHEAETKAKLEQMFSNCFNGSARTNYAAQMYTWNDGFTDSTSFDEYFHTRSTPYIFSAHIVSANTAPWDEQSTVRCVIEAIQAEGIDVAATFFFFTTSEDYDRGSVTDASSDVYRLFLCYYDNQIKSSSWRLVEE